MSDPAPPDFFFPLSPFSDRPFDPEDSAFFTATAAAPVAAAAAAALTAVLRPEPPFPVSLVVVVLSCSAMFVNPFLSCAAAA
jgi:hypothetical protein